MATALDTIARVILPNLMKLKGAATLVSAIERRDISVFANVWQQTGIAHTPQFVAKEKADFRIGVLQMPKPENLGEPWMVVFVAKKNDAAITRYFLLEHDYVLAKKQDKTTISEKEGQLFTKRGDGPPITGDFNTDASELIEKIYLILNPLLTKDTDRAYK